jgi:hypothetical protein
MPGPLFTQSYASDLVKTKYGYLGSILRPEMTQHEFRVHNTLFKVVISILS